MGDQVSHLLHFLHFRVGVIQYFNVEGLVMVKPQVLFSRVTDLVKRTFSCESLTSKEARDFQRGILTASLIEKVVKDAEIDHETFLKLLIRLHLVTPFTLSGDEEERYFIPCVLNHVQESNEDDLETDILPLFIRFQCEHCPKGLFGVLVAHLMTYKEPDSTISFSLIKDKIFRDQVSFDVHSCAADQDEISLKALPSHLEIKFFPSLCEERGVLIDEVCSAVREVIESCISKSLKYLGYELKKVSPTICLKCGSCHELHQIKKPKGMPHKIYCKRFRTTKPIPARHWFNKVTVSSSSISGFPGSSQIESGAAANQSASQTRLSEQDFASLYEQLRPHATKWWDIGAGLRFTGPELFTIQSAPAHLTNAPFSYLSAMLSIWLQWAPGDARGSKSYATLESLKTAVSRAGLGVPAEQLHL